MKSLRTDSEIIPEIANFQSSTQLFFGPGSAIKISEIALSAGLHKTFIVSDPGVRATGTPDRIASLLCEQGVESIIFDEVESNPSLETTEHAVAAYRISGCNGLVAVGGGSSIDVAKSVGILATNPGKLPDYFGIDKVVNRLPPLLVLPTTVGSGSEVTSFAVIMDRAQNKKLVIRSKLISPHSAFLDPDVVESLPSHLISSTSLDALTHAIESLISNFASPFSDALALEAIQLIWWYLPSAYRLKDKAAKAKLLYASTLAGMAFNNARTGLVHGMSHPLSSYYNLPHGLANAILLPYVLEYNSPDCEAAMVRLAIAIGEIAKPEAAIDAVRRLAALVDIPLKLSEVGVNNAYFYDMAQDAYESGNAQLVNPRKPTFQEILDIYGQAL